MKRYEHLEEAMCKELEKLDKKYGGDVAEMNVQDVERADLLYHALKSAATYHAMKDAEEWDEEMDGSGADRSYRMGRGGYGRGGSGRSYARRWDGSGYMPEWMPPYPTRY